MEPIVKSQPIRLLDIFIIGPLMVYGGTTLKSTNSVAGWALTAFGLGTILYNANNYWKIKRLTNG